MVLSMGKGEAAGVMVESMESTEEEQNKVLMSLIVEKRQTVLLLLFSVHGKEAVVSH